jgi:hypothetical protein
MTTLISHVYNELSKPESMNLDSIRKEYEEITLSDKLIDSCSFGDWILHMQFSLGVKSAPVELHNQ